MTTDSGPLAEKEIVIMGQITADQSQEIMATFATGVKWSEVDFNAFDLQNSVIRNKKEACRSFEAFLQNGCRLISKGFLRDTSELSIEIQALPRPSLKEIQKKCSWVKAIEMDTSLEGPVRLKLASVLCPDENGISGAEFERRLVPTLNVALGYQHSRWLTEHQNEYPALMGLLGKVYINFPGIVVADGSGSRYIPCCSERGGRWSDFCSGYGLGIGPDNRVAIADK
jgi:hypothetical protein